MGSILQDKEKQEAFKLKLDDLQEKYGHRLKEPIVKYFEFDHDVIMLKKSIERLPSDIEIELYEVFNEINNL